MRDYPAILTPAGHVEPVPRRIRATVGSTTIVDTTNALYVWEKPNYPAYYIPLDDVEQRWLVARDQIQHTRRGNAHIHDIVVGDTRRPNAARVLIESPIEGLAGHVRFDWPSIDAWYEEDEQVFVHPRDPYTRVDAIRSARHVTVSVDGAMLADTRSPVLVFETGLPTRYYLNRTDVDLSHLMPTDSVTACPYKGTTGGYWSVVIGNQVHDDLAWTYQFPTRDLLPIAGLIAFYNERVDITVDGKLQERPVTHFG